MSEKTLTGLVIKFLVTFFICSYFHLKASVQLYFTKM